MVQTNGAPDTGDLIRLVGLKKHYPVLKGIILPKTMRLVKAVDGVSFAIPEGQTYSLVGESGCGKTTTSRQILMVEQPTEGEIYYQGKSMREFTTSERREFHSSVQAFFQDPSSSLNPRMRVGKIIEEASPVELFTNPLHPYTKALISASLPAHPNLQREEIVLTGEVPSPLDPPSGCTFHSRCPVAFEPCPDQIPVVEEVTPGHIVTCHLFTGAEAPSS